MIDIERQDLDREKILTFWLKVENTECFEDISVYTVEVPVREYKKPEMIEAKQKTLRTQRSMEFLKRQKMKDKRQLDLDG